MKPSDISSLSLTLDVSAQPQAPLTHLTKTPLAMPSRGSVIDLLVLSSDCSLAYIAVQFMKIPHAKTGQPFDVASVVAYLVSPAAHFITGDDLKI